MKGVFAVDAARKQEVEEELKRDDKLSRGSILFRDGRDFGLEGKFILVYDGSEEMLERIREMEGIEEAEESEEILKKIEEEEERALHGFGSILG